MQWRKLQVYSVVCMLLLSNGELDKTVINNGSRHMATRAASLHEWKIILLSSSASLA